MVRNSVLYGSIIIGAFLSLVLINSAFPSFAEAVVTTFKFKTLDCIGGCTLTNGTNKITINVAERSFVTTYIGDGSTSSRQITVPFQPKTILISGPGEGANLITELSNIGGYDLSSVSPVFAVDGGIYTGSNYVDVGNLFNIANTNTLNDNYTISITG